MKAREWSGISGHGVSFYCPGCGCVHSVRIGDGSGWTFNGSLESPTLNPSILVTLTLYGPKRLPFTRYGGPPECETVEAKCHSFVKDGMIEFLSDSHHHLAGTTVELPDFEHCFEWNAEISRWGE